MNGTEISPTTSKILPVIPLNVNFDDFIFNPNLLTKYFAYVSFVNDVADPVSNIALTLSSLTFKSIKGDCVESCFREN